MKEALGRFFTIVSIAIIYYLLVFLAGVLAYQSMVVFKAGWDNGKHTIISSPILEKGKE